MISKLMSYGMRLLLVVPAALIMYSCASVAPVLTSAVVKFGQDVIQVASHNTSERYAEELEELLIALLRKQTGIDIPKKQGYEYAQGGYPQDPYSTTGGGQYGYGSGGSQAPYGYGGGTQDPYASGGGSQDPYGYGGSTQDPYATGSGGQYGYGGGTQDPYASGGGSQDPYGYGGGTQDPYATGGAAQTQYAYGSAAQGQYQVRTRGIKTPISMEAGLLAQRIQPDGKVTLEAIEDGDILHDGRGNPEAGDKLKITFKTNCDCYVYIIGIDATGFVAEIFPDPDSSIGNPVTAGQQYMFPEGDMWWGLDEYRGVETVYFVASHNSRADIEDVIARMANTERRIPEDYRTVQQAAVIPQTRGLVKVQSGQPIAVQTQTGSTYEVTPTDFTSAVSGVDLVITRWFHHQ
jgi:hypothetical protein